MNIRASMVIVCTCAVVSPYTGWFYRVKHETLQTNIPSLTARVHTIDDFGVA